jgi:hypothetical protein
MRSWRGGWRGITHASRLLHDADEVKRSSLKLITKWKK